MGIPCSRSRFFSSFSFEITCECKATITEVESPYSPPPSYFPDSPPPAFIACNVGDECWGGESLKTRLTFLRDVGFFFFGASLSFPLRILGALASRMFRGLASWKTRAMINNDIHKKQTRHCFNKSTVRGSYAAPI